MAYDIVTARKRSLGQGNVFTRICHSVNRGRGLCMMSLPVWLPGPMFLFGGLCPWSHVSSGGLCPWSHVSSGGLCPWSHVSSGGLCLWSHVVPCSFQGVFLTETSLDRDPPGQRLLWTETPLDRDLPRQRPPGTVTSGRCASY